jgi:HEAT repeat protein
MSELPAESPWRDRRDTSTADLFAEALEQDPDSEQYSATIGALRARATQEVFEMARQQCESCHDHAREVGLQVLAQLGLAKPAAERPWLEESLDLLLAHLDDPNPRAALAAAYGLGHLNLERGLVTLRSLAGHPSPNFRHAVAIGLAPCRDPESIHILIGLMPDPDDDVRNWATFAIGNMVDVDSSAIREALRARLDDPFEDAQAEAIWGLARRHDPEGLRILIQRLQADSWWQGDEDAATEILKIETEDVGRMIAGLRALIPNVH